MVSKRGLISISLNLYYCALLSYVWATFRWVLRCRWWTFVPMHSQSLLRTQLTWHEWFSCVGSISPLHNRVCGQDRFLADACLCSFVLNCWRWVQRLIVIAPLQISSSLLFTIEMSTQKRWSLHSAGSLAGYSAKRERRDEFLPTHPHSTSISSHSCIVKHTNHCAFPRFLRVLGEPWSCEGNWYGKHKLVVLSVSHRLFVGHNKENADGNR